jgi:hypothetical protein
VNDVVLTDMVKSYVRTRDDFVIRIGQITEQLNAWTDEHLELPPTLTDIARFEGLRAERSRLLSEFTEAEDAFVVQMLQRMSAGVKESA